MCVGTFASGIPGEPKPCCASLSARAQDSAMNTCITLKFKTPYNMFIGLTHVRITHFSDGCQMNTR